jgi:hypothetical protein
MQIVVDLPPVVGVVDDEKLAAGFLARIRHTIGTLRAVVFQATRLGRKGLTKSGAEMHDPGREPAKREDRSVRDVRLGIHPAA